MGAAPASGSPRFIHQRWVCNNSGDPEKEPGLSSTLSPEGLQFSGPNMNSLSGTEDKGLLRFKNTIPYRVRHDPILSTLAEGEITISWLWPYQPQLTRERFQSLPVPPVPGINEAYQELPYITINFHNHHFCRSLFSSPLFKYQEPTKRMVLVVEGRIYS